MERNMIVRMWEVRAHSEAFPELLTWVCDHALTGVEGHPSHVESEIFSSTDHRIVIISRWHRDPVDLPEPPKHLVRSSPHIWEFTKVDR
jgi:hypothetical protein